MNESLGSEIPINPQLGFIPEGTRLLSFNFTGDRPGGGYYEHRGWVVNADLLADPTGFTPLSIIGLPDGRRPNKYLTVKARIIGGIVGDFAIDLKDLSFRDADAYRRFVNSYQGTTMYQLPRSLDEWNKNYGRS